MAGINDLVKGAVGTLAKDKVSTMLSPAQMDFITFALNPQAYLLDKGVTAAADALGYGSQYRELKGGAQDEKDYYKEVMRDTIGDVLPEAIGDFVRVTPRASEAESGAAGTYTAWDPATESWTEQQADNPAVVFDPFAGDRFAAKTDITSQFNPNSQTYVGPNNPKSLDNAVTSQNLVDLYEMLGPYEQKDVPETGKSETKDIVSPNSDITELFTPTSGGGGDFAPRSDSLVDFGGTMDYSDVFGSSYGGGGGGGGGKYDYDFSSMAYRRGGQVCSCKH